MLPHETPLGGYAPEIGGSAGKGTHGSESIDRPTDMPTRDEADHIVGTQATLVKHIQRDGVTIYIDADISLNGVENVQLGSGVTLVGGFCDSDIKGRGPVLWQDLYPQRTFISTGGDAPTLWGVSLRGPTGEYFDPRERTKAEGYDVSGKDDWYASGLWCYDESELEVYGCEFWHWPMAGLEIGARDHETPATINRSSFHHCMMETLGYGIEHYNGDLWIDRCFFDSCRHGVAGFGYPSETVDITNCVIGPGDSTEGWCGHALDMHKLDDNLHNGDWTAGGHVRIRNCTSMCTRDRDGYAQEGFALRGTSEQLSWEDRNHWFQEKPPNAPGKQGDAYRQEVKTRANGWVNFEPRDSVFGKMKPADVPAGYGAPRTGTERARAARATEQPDEPHGEPATETKTVRIEGRGMPANYRLTVRGTASTAAQANPGDRVRTNDDGTVTIVGYVNMHHDTYDLSATAQLHSIRMSAPVDAYHGDESIDLAPLVGAGDWHRSNPDKSTTVGSHLLSWGATLSKTVGSLRSIVGGEQT